MNKIGGLLILTAIYLCFSNVGDLLARLAVINLTHEAKGLDTYEKTREKLEKGGDFISRDILERNYKEEVKLFPPFHSRYDS